MTQIVSPDRDIMSVSIELVVLENFFYLEFDTILFGQNVNDMFSNVIALAILLISLSS